MSGHRILATMVAVTVPIVLFSVNATESRAQSQAENTTGIEPLYRTVSIKPNRSGVHWEMIKTGPGELTVTNETLQRLIRTAYKVENDQISGAPNWLNSKRYDIEAKVGSSAPDEPHKVSPDQGELENQRMLQVLLSDRFKLAVHRETRQVPVYELVIAENGPSFTSQHRATLIPRSV